MDSQYRKEIYRNPCGFSLTHTAGFRAEDSTLQYLHRNDALMLICFLRGTGSITGGNRQFSLGPGDVILLNRMELYRCTVDGDSYHERLVIHLKDSLLQNFPCDCESLMAPFRHPGTGVGTHIPAAAVRESGTDSLFTELWELARKQDGVNAVLGVCKLMELLARLARLVPCVETDGRTDESVHPLIHRILEYIHAHFREDIRIAHIAAHFGLHPSYLSHLFKASMGTSPWNYIIRLRLNLFNERIRTNHSIEQTCYQAGFQNYANFFRLYRKYMGITPQQYKAQLTAGETGRTAELLPNQIK